MIAEICRACGLVSYSAASTPAPCPYCGQPIVPGVTEDKSKLAK